VKPERSREIHDGLLAHEEEIVQALGLPYRVQNIAAGGLGGQRPARVRAHAQRDRGDRPSVTVGMTPRLG